MEKNSSLDCSLRISEILLKQDILRFKKIDQEAEFTLSVCEKK